MKMFNYLFMKIIFNQVTEFDVLGDQHLVIGNNNGTLSVWDLDTAQMTVFHLLPQMQKTYNCPLLFPFLLNLNTVQMIVVILFPSN